MLIGCGVAAVEYGVEHGLLTNILVLWGEPRNIFVATVMSSIW